MWFKNNNLQGFFPFSLQQDTLGSHFPAFSCNKKEGKEDGKERKRRPQGNSGMIAAIGGLQKKKNPHQILW